MANRVFESAHQWNLYGSNGRQSLGGTFKRTWRTSGGEEVILVDMSIESVWLDRSAEALDYSVLRKDFAVTFSQVIVSRAKIEGLIESLAQWLDHPEDIYKKICLDKGDQHCELYFGDTAVHNRSERTNFYIQYSGIAFDSGKWAFGIDQSCVRIFIDELYKSLEELGRCA